MKINIIHLIEILFRKTKGAIPRVFEDDGRAM